MEIPAEKAKVCSWCLVAKPSSGFYKDRGECKVCFRALVAERGRRDKDFSAWRANQVAARNAQWIQNYRESIRSFPDPEPTQEQWRPVVQYEGLYEVSSWGRVRSLWFLNGSANLPRPVPVVLRTFIHKGGYPSLTLARGGIHKTECVHPLVLSAFRGPCPPGHIGGHRDGDPKNNLLTNLSWITRAENEEDKRRHGRMLIGSRNHQSKLTEKKARQIRLLHEQGVSGRKLAEIFSVSDTLIGRIVKRRTWKHVG